ncbi:MAG TPA: glycine zipper domain-containing protein [Burkholderiales bacterium]|nr:glycine zipper domain-containing protein [Burkholderiales bacterium]
MKRFLLVLASAFMLLAGCASAPWDDDGRGHRARPQPEHREYAGVVEGVREVQIDSERTGVAPMVGAVFGGAAGSSVGSGRGAVVGGVVGTVAGAVIGEAAAQHGSQPGLEVTVRLDEGRVIAVTQPAGETFQPGDPVRVISDGRVARVTKAVTGDR